MVQERDKGDVEGLKRLFVEGKNKQRGTDPKGGGGKLKK